MAVVWLADGCTKFADTLVGVARHLLPKPVDEQAPCCGAPEWCSNDACGAHRPEEHPQVPTVDDVLFGREKAVVLAVDPSQDVPSADDDPFAVDVEEIRPIEAYMTDPAGTSSAVCRLGVKGCSTNVVHYHDGAWTVLGTPPAPFGTGKRPAAKITEVNPPDKDTTSQYYRVPEVHIDSATGRVFEDPS